MQANAEYPQFTADDIVYFDTVLKQFNELILLKNAPEATIRAQINIIKNIAKPSTETLTPLIAYIVQAPDLSESGLRSILDCLIEHDRPYLQSIMKNYREHILALASRLQDTYLLNFSITHFRDELLAPTADGTPFIQEALSTAIISNSPSVFKFAIENGADTSAITDKAIDPLIFAVHHGLLSAVQHILSKSPRYVYDDSGMGAFHYAIDSVGVNPDAGSVLRTLMQRFTGELQSEFLKHSKNHHPLHLAIAYGNLDAVSIILDQMESPEALRDPEGNNLVIYACIRNAPEVAKLLIKRYPQLSLTETTPQGELNVAHLCCKSGVTPSIRWLYESYPKLFEGRTKSGNTAILTAAKNGQYQVICNLLWPEDCGFSKRKITIDVKATNSKGQHIGHFFAEHPEQINTTSPAIMQFPIDVIAPDNDGQTMLDIALSHGTSHDEIIRACLNKLSAETSTIYKSNAQIALANLRQREALCQFFTIDSNVTLEDQWLFTPESPFFRLVCEKLTAKQLSTLMRSLELDHNRAILDCLLKIGQTEKAFAFIALHTKQFKKPLDNHGTTLLHDAIEKGLLVLVQHCVTTLRLGLFTERQNKENALDIAITNQQDIIFDYLWNTLAEKDQEKYIAKLKKNTKSTTALDYLISKGLYTPPAPASSSSETPQLKAKTSKVTHPPSTIKPQKLAIKSQARPTTDSSQHEARKNISLDSLSDEELIAHASSTAFFKSLKNITGIEERLAPIKEELLKVASPGVLKQIEKIFVTSNPLTEEPQKVDSPLLVITKGPSSSDEDSIGHEERPSATPIDSTDGSAKCLFDAIDAEDYNFISSLKHNRAYDQELLQHRVALLSRAISAENTLMALHLLAIPVIEEGAHLENNRLLTLAQDKRCTDIIKALRKLPEVQRATPVVSSPFKPIVNEQIQRPACCEIPTYELVLEELSLFFKRARVKAFLYGSANYKVLPSDLDILIPEVLSRADDEAVDNIVRQLVERGAVVLAYHDNNKKYGYVAHNPERRVIPILWKGVKMEFICSPKTVHDHAQSLDFTMSSLYYDLRYFQFYQLAHSRGYSDLRNGIIDTINDPLQSFQQDLSIIFRAVRILATDSRFKLSTRCQTALGWMFYGTNNPFFSYEIPLKMLYQKLDEIFLSEYRHNSLKRLYELNILPKLIDYLERDKKQSIYYINALRKAHATFYGESLAKSQNIVQNSYHFFNRPMVPMPQPVMIMSAPYIYQQTVAPPPHPRGQSNMMPQGGKPY